MNPGTHPTITTISMKLANAELWQECLANNTDGYGLAINAFAERWAGLMEDAIASGETVASCAERTCDKADTDGITGFMYGCAVSILSKVWLHGEDLRRWHNKDVAIGAEGDAANESGGVLNPAILTLSVNN